MSKKKKHSDDTNEPDLTESDFTPKEINEAIDWWLKIDREIRENNPKSFEEKPDKTDAKRPSAPSKGNPSRIVIN